MRSLERAGTPAGRNPLNAQGKRATIPFRNPWRVCQDGKCRTYYVNVTSGETVWDCPVEGAIAAWDPEADGEDMEGSGVAIAEFAFVGEEDNEMTFKSGQYIEVLQVWGGADAKLD